MTPRAVPILLSVLLLLASPALAPESIRAQTAKPVLHGTEWVAITGKPRGAAAGAMMFQKGGNAVDATAAMLGVVSTMWDVLSWGGETQAIIYNPHTGEVIGVNALGWAPTGATADFFREEGHDFPPGSGPLAAVIPGTPGGLMVMLREFGTLSLADVLGPSIRLADGYPIERGTAGSIARNADQLREWSYSREVFLPREGEERETPAEGEIFRQPDLAATLRMLVDAEEEALAAGATREEAIQAAYDRFYRGDIAQEFVRGAREEGALITLEDLAEWEVRLEETRSTTYRDIEVHKLKEWTQGPVMLQALNILENADLQEMGYNSTRYIHTLYQAMNLAFADRDFYYGDPLFPPASPMEGLLSKGYAAERFQEMNMERNDPAVGPGDPYPFQGEENPFRDYLEQWEPNPDPDEVVAPEDGTSSAARGAAGPSAEEAFEMGTTSIQAADAEGWMVSVTPSGGWIPAVIAGRTGIGMSQRMQSFVLDEFRNPFNVVEPRKRPRVTLTPSLALRDGEPFLSFAVQGGDYQDQYLLQLFLNMVEFGMNVQEAVEAPNIRSHQMRGSFGDHLAQPGRLHLNEEVPSWVRRELGEMGYDLSFGRLTSGPLNAIWFDRENGAFWGGASNFGDDYGIAW